MLNFGREPQSPIVLLIDDDIVSREVMATVLTMSDYSVHTAEDGQAALDLLDAGECVPGLILMDAQMPGLSGAELMKQLRARIQASIFVISASRPPEEVVAAADGFLLKPFGAEALRALLEKQRPAPAPEPAQKRAEPVVSEATLAQLRALMPETAVREIYAAVVTDLGKRLEALEDAIATGDAAKVRRIGHAIKGGCGMAGAMQAAHLGAQLEAGSDNLDHNVRVVGDLRDALRNLERMLKIEFPA
jgi:CheY-like chemotaxis protein/HPt (histidine-containing phosphotransfer) domain-containing protein